MLSLYLKIVYLIHYVWNRGICRRDFEEVGRRRIMAWYHFLDDLMVSTIQTLILDFYDFHARIN